MSVNKVASSKDISVQPHQLEYGECNLWQLLHQELLIYSKICVTFLRWFLFHTNMCIWWDIAVAKKRKFKQARGISTARASQTGFPWSRDSAIANSSRRASMPSAILLSSLARSLAGMRDHLNKSCFVTRLKQSSEDT